MDHTASGLLRPDRIHLRLICTQNSDSELNGNSWRMIGTQNRTLAYLLHAIPMSKVVSFVRRLKRVGWYNDSTEVLRCVSIAVSLRLDFLL